MVLVSWGDAQKFCEAAGGRLPTEAEWEYAARSGKDDTVYPLNSENSRDKANFYGKQGNDTYEEVAPVHSFDPNGFNVYDMAGNVWEWVSDWYDPNSYKTSSLRNPTGPPRGDYKVVRGGSWGSGPKDLRSTDRETHLPSFRGYGTGFRCAKTP